MLRRRQEIPDGREGHGRRRQNPQDGCGQPASPEGVQDGEGVMGVGGGRRGLVLLRDRAALECAAVPPRAVGRVRFAGLLRGIPALFRMGMGTSGLHGSERAA